MRQVRAQLAPLANALWNQCPAKLTVDSTTFGTTTSPTSTVNVNSHATDVERS